MNRNLILALASIAAPVLGGCGSNTTEAVDSGADAGATLYGLSAGDNCYTILSAAVASDGCGIEPGKLVNQSLPMNYDATTATVKLGTDSALGGGVIANNAGTLVRDGNTSFTTTTDATCTLHQTDTTQLQMTANNTFTVSVTEVQSNFGATCGADAPATDPCTSTWTWTLQKSAVTTLTFPECGATP